jgi:triphosphoribosyl-dephospho-CoA synthase
MYASAVLDSRRPGSAPRRQTTPLAERLADLVVSALIDEVTLTPKPGLVDMRSQGAHLDLNWMLMCHSAKTLRPTFTALATAGQIGSDRQKLREHIGRIGRRGEVAMMKATGGINTHRGAIWALGLLVTAAAQDVGSVAPELVATRAGELSRLDDRYAPAITANKGERACREYGVGGARGQAQAGFPHVIAIALPELRRSRHCGESEKTARLNALLAVMAQLDDTCLLARGGKTALAIVHASAARALSAGGAGRPNGKKALQQLEEQLLARHLSPGGAADLLAATLFLDRLETEFLGLN